MEILLLIDSLGSGGAQRQIVTLAELLEKNNFKVSILVYYEDDFFKTKLNKLNVLQYKIEECNVIERIWKTRQFIRKRKFNFVVSFLDTPNFLNCLSSIGRRSWKVITCERSSNESFFNSTRGKFFAWFQRFSDLIICNSNNAKNIWIKYYPKYEDKLDVIYNSVSLPEISSKYTPKRNNKLNIVIAASYQFIKNPLGLIKALALLNPKDQEKIEINWYGRIEPTKGDKRAFMEAIEAIKDYNLTSIIHLHDQTKDISNLMYESDIVALFSAYEGLPNTIIEGMMLGKLIIMSKVSDYSLLVDKSNGFLCDWDNPNSIKEALMQALMLSNEELIEKGIKSKEKALKLFSNEIILHKWLSYLK